MDDDSPTTARLEWIGLRPERRKAVHVVDSARAVETQGLDGDRFVGRPGGAGTRQVTLVRVEDLSRAAERLSREVPLDPAQLRRNLAVVGLEPDGLRDGRLRIGPDVVLEITGGCPPCDQMEETVGPGGREALKGLGGATARVVRGGVLRIGDPVEKLPGT
jgi:MOSC domain-containing protein YiiM